MNDTVKKKKIKTWHTAFKSNQNKSSALTSVGVFLRQFNPFNTDSTQKYRFEIFLNFHLEGVPRYLRATRL